MATALARGWGFRGRASLALLLHLFLVGLVPMGEALHDHEPASDSEWYSDGSHEHGDEPAGECPLLLGTTSAGIVSEVAAPTECMPVDRFVSELVLELPRPADPLTAVSARGPPAR